MKRSTTAIRRTALVAVALATSLGSPQNAALARQGSGTTSGATAGGAAAGVAVTHAWARATAPHQLEAAIYLSITAASGDRLLAAASGQAAMTMLHRTSAQGGISEMRDVEGLDLPAGRAVLLAPRGTHIMLSGLQHDLRPGDVVSLTLSFAKAGKLQILVPVLPIGAQGPVAGQGL